MNARIKCTLTYLAHPRCLDPVLNELSVSLIYFQLWFRSSRVLPLNSQGIMMFLKLVSVHIEEVAGVGVTVLPLLSILVPSSKLNIYRCVKFGSVCI